MSEVGQTWEYDTVEMPTLAQLEKSLSTAGIYGWEAVSLAVYVTFNVPSFVVLLKRPNN